MKNPLVIAVLLLFLLAACENHNTGEVTARIRFAAVQKAEGAKLSTRAAETEGLLIDSATLSLQNIRLLVQNSNNQIIPGNTVFAGPYLINLVTRKSTPVIESSAVPAGTYFGINALLYVPQNTKYSIYVSGTYTLNDKWWKFYYTNSGALTFQVIDSLGFTVDATHPEVWVGIDVVSFFRGVDLSKAVPDNDNVIRISESSNLSFAVAIQKNFILAASVSNNPATGEQSSGGSSGGSSSSGQGSSSGSTSTTNNSSGSTSGSSGSGNTSGSSGSGGSASNSGSTSQSSGTVTASGSNSQGQDSKDAAKQKEKDKEKDKNGNKSKHEQKDNNKSKDKDKNKDKDKDKNGH